MSKKATPGRDKAIVGKVLEPVNSGDSVRVMTIEGDIDQDFIRNVKAHNQGHRNRPVFVVFGENDADYNRATNEPRRYSGGQASALAGEAKNTYSNAAIGIVTTQYEGKTDADLSKAFKDSLTKLRDFARDHPEALFVVPGTTSKDGKMHFNIGTGIAAQSLTLESQTAMQTALSQVLDDIANKRFDKPIPEATLELNPAAQVERKARIAREQVGQKKGKERRRVSTLAQAPEDAKVSTLATNEEEIKVAYRSVIGAATKEDREEAQNKLFELQDAAAEKGLKLAQKQSNGNSNDPNLQAWQQYSEIIQDQKQERGLLEKLSNETDPKKSKDLQSQLAVLQSKIAKNGKELAEHNLKNIPEHDPRRAEAEHNQRAWEQYGKVAAAQVNLSGAINSGNSEEIKSAESSMARQNLELAKIQSETHGLSSAQKAQAQINIEAWGAEVQRVNANNSLKGFRSEVVRLGTKEAGAIRKALAQNGSVPQRYDTRNPLSVPAKSQKQEMQKGSVI